MNKYLLIYIIFSINISFSLPRFTIQNGISCVACHVNPTGGGMRNSYGNDIVSLEELPFERWIRKGNDSWDGYIGEHLQIGGDFRIQGIQYDNTDTTRKSALFPMQADIYTFIKLNHNASIFTKIGAKDKYSLNAEYWILLNNLPMNSWFKIGKTLPNYGLKIDDHTSFIRGGNGSKTKVLNINEEEGLLWGHNLDPPIIIEFGASILKNLIWTTSVGTGIVFNKDELENLVTQINYINSINNIYKYMLGFSYMKEGYIEMIGFSSGISFYNFIYSFEFDQIENWINNYTTTAIYNELSWKIFQGLHIILKNDFFDPQKNWQSGSINRYTFGAEIFPLNILEIRPQIRINKIDNKINKPNPEYLIQTHFWF